MNFTFRIGDKIKEAWPLYKNNLWTLLLMTLVTFIVQFGGQARKEDITLTFATIGLALVSAIVSLYLSYMWIRLTINIVDKKEFSLYSNITLPTLGQIWNYIKINILYMLCIFGGFILLIVPGFYIAGRLVFAVYISVEKNQGARASIKESWEMTKDNGWLLFWKSLVVGLFIAIGFLALFVGSFITYPIGFMLMIMMYREFVKFKLQSVSTPVSNSGSVSNDTVIENSFVTETNKSL